MPPAEYTARRTRATWGRGLIPSAESESGPAPEKASARHLSWGVPNMRFGACGDESGADRSEADAKTVRMRSADRAQGFGSARCAGRTGHLRESMAKHYQN